MTHRKLPSLQQIERFKRRSNIWPTPEIRVHPYLQWCTTYRSPLVTADDVEDLTIEGQCFVQIQIFPMPVVTLIVLWQPLSLYQFALRHPTVLNVRLYYRNTVVFQVIEDDDRSHPEVLVRRLVHRLLVVSVKLEYLWERGKRNNIVYIIRTNFSEFSSLIFLGKNVWTMHCMS